MKFLHTADWQLGLKLNWVDPEKAAHLRLLRYQTAERIAEVARAHGADFVVVAGDVLDDNALGLDALQRTSEALRAFAGMPVYLLPGNHDAATEDSALRRLNLPTGCHFLERREAVSVPGGTLFPCPLMRRHEVTDPTAWLPHKGGAPEVWVALAHGGVLDFSEGEDTKSMNRIDSAAILAKGFDYVALGDWHGLFRLNDRVWYSGAHEATRFKEKDPGQVLIVDIESAGAVPKVTPVPVAQTLWRTHEVEFSQASQVDELRQMLEGLPRLSQVLMQIHASGTLSLAARTALDALCDEYRERLAHLRMDTETLHTEPTDDDLSELATEGLVGRAFEVLRASQDPLDEAAIRLMYRLQKEAADAAA